MKNYIQYFLDLLSDIVFPESQKVQRLTSLSLEDFISQAHYAVDQPESTLPYLKIQNIFSYHDPLVQQAIWELKYRGNGKIVKLLAGILYDYIIESLADEVLFSNFSSPLVIPIPLSKERLKERGWNQSEMLAYELEKIDKNRNFKIETRMLEKIIHTKPQTTLTRPERMKNLKGCFAITGVEKIKNRNIILLDDVTTTGSTLSEAARVLRHAGARQIRAFTIAH